MANPNFLEKSEIRRRMRERLAHLQQTERHQRSLTICRELAFHLNAAKTIALFSPSLIEPDLNLLWELGLVQGKRTLYPGAGPREMRFYEINSLEELRPGRFGLLEPRSHDAPAIPDLLIVPGQAFTRDGHRLGRGGGYYDRFIAQHPGIPSIGICFDFQVVEQLPLETHDMPMALVVTD
jgi:5-formyltetrahydrofolate cyclo-ligase